jgi:hypothetical protein
VDAALATALGQAAAAGRFDVVAQLAGGLQARLLARGWPRLGYFPDQREVPGPRRYLCAPLPCVPMPIGWLAVIAPHNADVWSRALAPLHEPGPSWAPISGGDLSKSQ